MSSTSRIDSHYATLEAEFTVRPNGNYTSLVTANGNAAEPLHRWFHMKEAFSAHLLPRILKDVGLHGSQGIRILDPFSGVGTTVVSALSMTSVGDLKHPIAYGIEVNPFLHLVASAKVRALLSPPIGFMEFARMVAGQAYRNDERYPPPELSTFRNAKYFPSEVLNPLLRLREAIRHQLSAGAPPLLVELAQVALGSCVEKCANLRRDGRALRYEARQDSTHPIDVFLRISEMYAADLQVCKGNGHGNVFRGNGVTMATLDGRFAPFDLAVFSPPYPNNIDYTEVYKLENWFLQFHNSGTEFRQQRLATLHSHPSLQRSGHVGEARPKHRAEAELAAIIRPILESLPLDRYTRARSDLIEGYASDMLATMDSAARRLRAGGSIAVVVGNSVHGAGEHQCVIAADLIIAKAAQLVGLEVQSIEVARPLRRRGRQSKYLRESVLFATRP